MAKRTAEVLFIGNAASIVKAARQGEKATQRFGKTAESTHNRARKSFAGLTSSALKMGAGVAGAYASIAGAKQAIATTEELAKSTIGLHKNLGLSVTQASRWAAVAKARGIDSKQLAQAFGILGKNAVAAGDGQDKQRKALDALGGSQADVKKRMALLSTGAGAQAKVFKTLGLSQQDVKNSGRDFSGFLGKVSDGLAKMPAGVQRNTAAMKLFGKGWQTVVPVLRGGSKAMNEQLALADKYGVTFKGKTIKSLEDLIKAQRETKFATMGLQVAFGTYLAPALTKAMQATAHFFSEMRAGHGTPGKIAHTISNVVKVLGALIRWTIRADRAWGEWNRNAVHNVARFASGVARFMGNAAATVRAFPGKVLGYFKALPGKMLHAGEAMISGLVKGIENKASDVINAIKNTITDKVPSFVKGVFGIHSPSRVFMTIGEQVAEGFSIGIRNGAGSIRSALNLGFLYPLDAAIAGLNAKKEKLQASFDAWDARRSRAGLLTDLAGAGTSTGGGSSSGGSTGGLHSRKGNVVNFLSGLARGDGLTVTSTTGGKHAAGSNHYKGLAIDAAGSADKMMAFAKDMAKRFGPKLLELFYDPMRTYIKDGKRVAGAIGGHADHVHIAAGSVLSGGASRGGRRGTGGGGGVAGQAFATARQMGASGKIMLALAEAGLVESHFKNLKGGDRDSVGFLQQRASQGWKGLRNVPRATAEFVRAAMKVNSRGMTAGQLAQAVQRSGFPDRYDQARGRAKALLGTTGRSLGGGGGSGRGDIQSALKALRDFDREAERAKKLKTIDLKIQGIERLKAFKEAISGLRDQLKGLAQQAAQAWRAIQEKGINAAHDAAIAAISGSADAMELAGLQATDQAKQDADTQANLARDMADAIAAGDVDAQRKAQDAIDAYARQTREQELTSSLDAARAGADSETQVALDALDQQTADYEAGLNAQFGVLTNQLSSRKIAYATWAQETNAILAQYGLSVATDSSTEAAVAPGAPAVAGGWTQQFAFGWGGHGPKRPRHHRASGGWVYPGESYTVGEVGRETFTPMVKGHIAPASQSARGGGAGLTINYNAPVHIGSQRGAERMADRLSFRMKYG